MTAFSVEDPSVRGKLATLVRTITNNPWLGEDLMQEALVHTWLNETRRPGQTWSWYLQSCKFHLKHYLASGRSIDSLKRQSGRVQFEWDEEGDGELDGLKSTESLFETVSARDIVACLSDRLMGSGKSVLNCLADGLGSREIGRRLNMSHTSVIKERGRIASCLRRLERIRVAA
jgi:DNA-directed RNA polymerase specialized sigma24 family protein